MAYSTNTIKCTYKIELKDDYVLSKEKIKEISNMFDGIAYEQLMGATSIRIALKRYKLRKAMCGR